MTDEEFENPNPPATHAKTDLGNVDEALAAGIPGAKFEAIGAICKGVILSAEMAQQRDMATGKPKFWPDGNPCTQILIMLATEERSPDIEDDNGHRRLYVKKPSAMLAAIAKALDKTKLSQAIGGTLAVKYTGDGEPTQRGFNAPKLFAVRFTPAYGAATKPASNLPTADSKTAAWKEFCAKVPNLDTEGKKVLWKKTVEKYSGKPIATPLSPSEWKIVGNKIAEYGPYVEELAPPEDVEAGPGIPADDIPFAPNLY